MSHISILGDKIPLVGLEFFYTKNGDFVNAPSKNEAIDAAYCKGDGSGNVYAVEGFLFKSARKIISVTSSALLPDTGQRFSGKAALRKNGLLSRCLHEETNTVFKKTYESTEAPAEFVSCAACSTFLKKIIYTKDVNGNVVKTGQLYLGTKPDFAEWDFVKVPSNPELHGGLLIEGANKNSFVIAPLVYIAYAVHAIHGEVLTFGTEEKAIQASLQKGDGRLEYLRTRLFQFASPEISYEIEVTETISVEQDNMSKIVKTAKEKLDRQASCNHDNKNMENVLLNDGELGNEEIEIVSFSCKDCGFKLEDWYYMDSCQPAYSRELMKRTEKQELCSHEDTFEKVTPDSYLGCLLCDASMTTHCTACDAMLYTRVSEEPFELIQFNYHISAAFLF